MAHINLLPWREELRKEQTRQFASMSIMAAVFTAAVILLIHVNFSENIDHQISRNALLEREIAKLENELKEIKDLEETKSKLLARMEIIQSLQQRRPQIVHVFDDIVRTIPDGIFLTSIEQQGQMLKFTGMAESNGRISAYMRNIDASDWLDAPKLKVIEAKRKDGRGSEFILEIKKTAPNESEEDR
ncbi:MAG: PilN domain-containing protein [Gammaproteobacteria bacterium]|nr:PilN domain-containing protein [Gammaproteobacteria bacterium]